MAKLLAPVLRLDTLTDEDAILKLIYQVIFEEDEAGFLYDVIVSIYPIDKGVISKPKPIIRGLVLDQQVRSAAGIQRYEHDMRLSRSALNEDRKGRDEIYARFTLRPVNEPIHGRTPPLHGEFGGLRFGASF